MDEETLWTKIHFKAFHTSTTCTAHRYTNGWPKSITLQGLQPAILQVERVGAKKAMDVTTEASGNDFGQGCLTLMMTNLKKQLPQSSTHKNANHSFVNVQNMQHVILPLRQQLRFHTEKPVKQN